MTPQDLRSGRIPRALRKHRAALLLAAPTVAALALGVMLLGPAVFASSATGQPVSVWNDPNVGVRPTFTGSPQPTASEASAAPSQPSIPKATIPAGVTTAPAATKSASKSSTTTKTVKTATATVAQPTLRPAPASAPTVRPSGPTYVSVNLTGGQDQIDLCKGPVLYDADIIVQHASCGGTRWYGLKAGDVIILSGTYVTAGSYRVTSVQTYKIGTSDYVKPYPYALQTCISFVETNLWYLQRI